MSVLALHIVDLLERHRLPLQDEKALQAEIERIFTTEGVDFQREVHLSACDIVDFMVRDIALEVKVKGPRRPIFRQLERYAAHEDVREIMLATNVVMGLPETICGKPTALVQLGRAWL